MAQQEIAGTVYVKVDGTQYDVEGTCKLKLGGATRTMKMGLDGRVLGWVTKYSAPELSIDISDSGGLSLRQMQALNGSTLTVELGNGKTYLLENAVNLDVIELDTVEGKVPWKLSAMNAMEQTA